MKQKERTELTKEKIMEAAMREFGTNGYSGASLNAVCGAGISKGLLYHNFKNKDELYLSCVERCFNGLTDSLRGKPLPQSTNEYLSARLCYFDCHKVEAHLFFEALLLPPAPLREAISQLRAEFDAYNRRAYLSILSRLSLRAEITQEDALAYFTFMQTIFNAYFSSPAFQEMPFDERITAHEEGLPKLMEYLLYGIAEREKKE